MQFAGPARLLDLAAKAWPSPGTESGGMWESYQLRLRRQRLLFRALRKRREISAIADRTGRITPQAILCLATVRNEIARLPFFLDHHRRLGVAHFLIVDNDSSDGTQAFLRDQPDVSLWGTPCSYKRARFGMDWLTWLMIRHGHGHWCLTLDADETFIYPHWDSRPLQALTDWLDSQGMPSFGAVLLDMYPKGPLGAGTYLAGEDPFRLLEGFDPHGYRVTYQPRLRNLWIQGGPRARAFFQAEPARAPTLNKIPLVKWNRRHAYVTSTHVLLPRHLNRVFADRPDRATGALLHSKFLPEIVAKSREEQGRRQHFANSDLYTHYYAALVQGPVLWSGASASYADWQQLETLGLISRGGWT